MTETTDTTTTEEATTETKTNTIHPGINTVTIMFLDSRTVTYNVAIDETEAFVNSIQTDGFYYSKESRTGVYAPKSSVRCVEVAPGLVTTVEDTETTADTVEEQIDALATTTT
jgi:hypothetical protein